MLAHLRQAAAAGRGVAAIAALWLAAASPGLARAETHVVNVEGMAFMPSTLTIKRGDQVVWRNKDLVPHTATAPGRFDSGNIASDKSWARLFKEPGRYEYVCTYHPGMKAALVVR
jgi:plastocyanin